MGLLPSLCPTFFPTGKPRRIMQPLFQPFQPTHGMDEDSDGDVGQASHSQAGPTGAMRPHHALSRVGRIRPAHGIWQPVCCRWIAPRARRESPSLRCIGQLLFPTHHALGVMPCLCPASHPRAVCAPTRHTHHPSPPCTLSLPCRPPSTGPSHDFMETDDGCHTPGAEAAAAGSEEVCMCPSALLPPHLWPSSPRETDSG